MALELTYELRAALRKAKPEEVEAILAKAGQEATEEEIERLKFELNRAAEHDGEEVSLDELDAVGGGDAIWERSYYMEGCAATVEFGSSCWGTDGGCSFVNIEYLGGPVNVKCSCGHYMYKDTIQLVCDTHEGAYGVLKCPYCKSTINVDARVYDGL